MKQLFISYLLLIAFSVITSCADEQKPAVKENEVTIPEEVRATTKPGEPIIGERINGPANIRDKINGEVLFSLNHGTLVSCSELDSNWYAVGVEMELPVAEPESDSLLKGRKIVVDGKDAGTVLRDMPVSISSTNKTRSAYLVGYTHRENIDTNTIIENEIVDYLQKDNERSYQSLLPFITIFKMEKEAYSSSFLSYFVHESWVDDPSPLMRLQLIFHEDRLIGVLHARKLKIPNTKDYTLEREFTVSFFNDTKPELIKKFIKEFNTFITQVD